MSRLKSLLQELRDDDFDQVFTVLRQSAKDRWIRSTKQPERTKRLEQPTSSDIFSSPLAYRTQSQTQSSAGATIPSTPHTSTRCLTSSGEQGRSSEDIARANQRFQDQMQLRAEELERVREMRLRAEQLERVQRRGQELPENSDDGSECLPNDEEESSAVP